MSCCAEAGGALRAPLMMFYLSKIVWGLFQPSSLLVVFFAAGVLFSLSGRRRAAARLFASGAVLYRRFRLFAPGKLGAGAP